MIVAAAGGDEKKVPFGYTRADVLLTASARPAREPRCTTGSRRTACPPLGGEHVQLTFVLGLSVAWVGSYVARVMNKDMTYVKQLKDYEDG